MKADRGERLRAKLATALEGDEGFAGVAMYRDRDGHAAAVMVINDAVDTDDFAHALRTLAERVSPLIGEPVTTWNPVD